MYLAGFLASIALSSCKEDKITPPEPVVQPNQLEIIVEPYFGATHIEESTVFTTAEGYDVQLTNMKFYLTNVGNNGSVLASASLFDWLNGNRLLKVDADYSLFSNLSGNIGVNPTDNHADPAAFANDNPLNITIADDMHWNWNPGYIFLKIEAKVDTLDDGNALFDHNVVLHIGKDENLQLFQLNDLTWNAVSDKLHRASLKVDLETFLQNDGQNIDLKTENSSHSAPGQEALSLKVIENFKAALTEL